MANRKRSRVNRELAHIANSLTVEQVTRLYEFIQPIPTDERTKLDALTDDELLTALGE